MRQAYGQLLDNSTTLWAESYRWFPGKWLTVALLRRAARDAGYHAAVAARAPKGDDDPPSLRDLVSMAFEVVLILYGPALPFGGYWVRAARDFVLEHLDRLFVPVGLVVRAE